MLININNVLSKNVYVQVGGVVKITHWSTFMVKKKSEGLSTLSAVLHYYLDENIIATIL